MTDSNSQPSLIYDGDCGFCRLWIERWDAKAKGKVIFESSQDAGDKYPDIAPTDFQKAVQWIDGDKRAAGAEAIFLMLAILHPRLAPLIHWLVGWGIFIAVANLAYAVVAKYRYFFSLLVRTFHGRDLRPPTYALSQKIFLRLLAVIYAIALLSFYVQADGLIGENGITPAADYFRAAETQLGGVNYLKIPSIFWWDASDAALKGWTLAGIVVSVLVFAGIAPLPGLVFLWILYLSICLAGQGFYQFQWDLLLLETGFLSIFLAPLALRGKGQGNPPRLMRWLMIWLLFRLIFLSGIVKLQSGDACWSVDGTAMMYHFFTQPLPTPLAWYAQQLPADLLHLSTYLVVWGEIILPFFLLGPRRVRLATAGILIVFQFAIAATGNYGFFNLLSVALCLWVIDDRAWRRLRLHPREQSLKYLPRGIIVPVAVLVFVFSSVPFLVTIHWFPPALFPLARAYEWVAPFRSFNGYGLFAVMTTERREIIIQGSDDGYEWKTYQFRYKPSEPGQPLPWVAPHMPRLDWQMWFAALGSIEQNSWFARFAEQLLRASPEVTGLLAEDPFAGRPPRYIRALVDRYRFSTPEERNRDGTVWQADPLGFYLREVVLERQ